MARPGIGVTEGVVSGWHAVRLTSDALSVTVLPGLRGAYGLGIEPWATGGNLEQAVADGTALRLAGQARLETRLTATIQDC